MSRRIARDQKLYAYVSSAAYHVGACDGRTSWTGRLSKSKATGQRKQLVGVCLLALVMPIGDRKLIGRQLTSAD
jgi:hypothetical protein